MKEEQTKEIQEGIEVSVHVRLCVILLRYLDAEKCKNE